MAKLLILSSDTGEGHNSVAKALETAAARAGLASSVRRPIEDSGSFNRALASFYNTLLTRRPGWVTHYFRFVDSLRPNERDFLYNRCRSFIGHFVDQERPDVLLSVHPMLNHFIQRFIKEEHLGIPCYTFLTDPFPPFWRGWASPYTDRYFVPSAEALQALTAMGIPSWRIEKVPMPVRPQFCPLMQEDVDALRDQFPLRGAPTILINGGARGGGPLFAIYSQVRRAAPAANVLVVCGRNESLFARIAGRNDENTRVFGFIPDIHRYIAASDLVLTKPGAQSTYEALACRVPPLLLGIGGLMPQESGLFRAAVHYEFGFTASRLGDVADVVARGLNGWRKIQSSLAQFYHSSSGEELIERIHPHHVHA